MASAPSAAPEPVSATYDIDSNGIANPERGFMLGFTSPLTTADMSELARRKYTVAHLNIPLAPYRDTRLTPEILQQISADFATARAAAVKLVLRFAYDFTSAGSDAPLANVLAHISQLKPLLHANSDVLLYLDAGFVGAWGEWHHSVHGLISADPDGTTRVNSATRTIASSLLDALPPDRMLLVRTQRIKSDLLQVKANLSAPAAGSGTPQARIGFHNDCFLADATDMGTYVDRGADQKWLGAETRFVPLSGETCSTEASAQAYLRCPAALRDLTHLHWSLLRSDWYAPAIQEWRDQGCLDTIATRLGYRFNLTSASTVSPVSAGGTLPLSFSVSNSGFAPLYNQRQVALVLRNTSSGHVTPVPLDVDPRSWAANTTTDVRSAVALPQDLPAGRYDLLLWLPDPAESLNRNPAAAIRFANKDVWEATTGFNALHLAVTVG